MRIDIVTIFPDYFGPVDPDGRVDRPEVIREYRDNVNAHRGPSRAAERDHEGFMHLYDNYPSP